MNGVNTTGGVKVKSKLVWSVGIIGAGTLIGIALVFFGSGLTVSMDLGAGAIFGALLGFYFAVTATVPTTQPVPFRRPGMG